MCVSANVCCGFGDIGDCVNLGNLYTMIMVSFSVLAFFLRYFLLSLALSLPFFLSLLPSFLPAFYQPDYSPSSIPSSITIPAGELKKCFDVTILDDMIALEGNESFTINMVVDMPNFGTTGNSESEVTIIDNDGEIVCYITRPLFSALEHTI